jgi:hypothetical protein
VAKIITFPESEPEYVFNRDCLAFHANVDGKSVKCMVTAEFLMTNFRIPDSTPDFSEEAMRNAYRVYKLEIQKIATDHIENGWIDDDSRIFLTTRFTRLNVKFGERYDESPRIRTLVVSAHRILLDLIGPNAEAVNVEWREWNGDEDPPGHPGISVRIADPDTSRSGKVFFGPKESDDPNTLRVYLALLWSGILRERSRKLNLKVG